MRMLFLPATVFACVLGILQSSLSADEGLKLTINAGEFDRHNTPISVFVDASADAKSVCLKDGDGNLIAAQLTALGLQNEGKEGKSELHFVLPSLKRGKPRKLTAQFSNEPAQGGFSWKEEADEYAELSLADRPVVRYICKTLTDENREDAYKVYHHVYDLAGTRFITKGSGGKYPHHRGLFFGYNQVTYGDGRKANTWSGQTTPQTHAGFLADEAGPVLGRHLAAVDWRGAKNDVYLTERRELAVYNTPGGTLIEFTSRVATAGGTVRLDGNAAHAGFQFRADQEVAEGTEKQTCYLRPDGKGELGQARGSAFDLPWDAISFVLDEKRYTVLYLDHPENHKPTEYNERTYGRFGSFFPYELDDGKDLMVKYRVWVQDGEMTVEQATALSNDFADPPQVTIE
ncbi:MAG: PmoA family protein [Planctomycetes bacterium]|nr:PmoA family protein [Planctomycetota bacterium]MBL7043963.1 PmoA family protein [Pirellulaceae bacterium]